MCLTCGNVGQVCLLLIVDISLSGDILYLSVIGVIMKITSPEILALAMRETRKKSKLTQ